MSVTAEQKKIRRALLTLLARRDHSRLELMQKLQAKQFDSQIIQQFLNEFSQAGYINEARLAENLVHWRRNRGYGPLRIAQELKTRGIDHEVIAQVLDMAAVEWQTHLRQLWQKHFRGKKPTTFQERCKQLRFFQYRGFTRDQIESLLGSVED